MGGTGSITAVQVKGPQSDWEGMSNKWGAAWEIDHAPKYPLDIHLTNDQGQEVRGHSALLSSSSRSVEWSEYSIGLQVEANADFAITALQCRPTRGLQTQVPQV